MRRLFFIGICLLPVMLFGLSSSVAASANSSEKMERLTFTTRLAGANEVPAVQSDLRGKARITINLNTNMLCWDLHFRTKTQHVVAAHIHHGAAGAVAPPAFGLFPPPSTPSSPNKGCRVAPATLLADIVANPSQYYVNIHTTEHPGGAGRGQLKARHHD